MEERYAQFDDIVVNELIPFIDANYRTIPDRDHRALAGLSMGAAQALRIGLNHLDEFAYLGAFSRQLRSLTQRKTLTESSQILTA